MRRVFPGVIPPVGRTPTEHQRESELLSALRAPLSVLCALVADADLRTLLLRSRALLVLALAARENALLQDLERRIGRRAAASVAGKAYE